MKAIDHLENIIKLVKKNGLCKKFFDAANVHLDAVGN